MKSITNIKFVEEFRDYAHIYNISAYCVIGGGTDRNISYRLSTPDKRRPAMYIRHLARKRILVEMRKEAANEGL